MKKIAKYEIVEQLGKGGMGIVYKAFDPLMEREVAIKVLAEQLFDQPEIRERFYREARSAGKLSHENITIVHDLGEIEGKPYIVMEYLPGTDLKQIIKQQEKLTLLQKLDFARQISKGLAFSHSKNIVHRDIKPENIRVLKDGKVKIMDFGIAKPTTSTMTRTGIAMGTPHYMSPEQIKGEKVGPQSDIFSFGILMYELFTYKLPFEGNDTTVIWYKIVHEQSAPIDESAIDHISGIKDIILKCLQKDATKRYKQISDATRQLEQIIRQVELKKEKSADEEDKKIAEIIAKSRKLVQKGEFKKALENADLAIEITPGNPLVKELISEIKKAEHERIVELLSQGREALKKEDFASATKKVRELLVLKPAEVDALKLKAEIEVAKRAVESETPTIIVPRKTDKPPQKQDPVTKKPSQRALLIAAVAILIVGGSLLYRMFTSSTAPTVGHVALNILPWAEITKIVDEEGTEMTNLLKPGVKMVTPSKLSMPPGMYRISLRNPAFEPLTIDVEVQTGELMSINKKLPDFDYQEVLSSF